MVPNGFGRVKTIFSIFPRKIGLLRTSLDFFGPRYGGRCEIRTHEDLATLPVFKTGAFNRSANLPGLACRPRGSDNTMQYHMLAGKLRGAGALK